MYINPAMLQLPNALQRRGVTTFLVDGCGSRGAAGMGMASKIYAPILHWIVSTFKGSARRQTLGLIINGRPGLPGPLANLYLDFDGACGVVAMGRANHGGVGSWRGVSGNQYFIGIEAEGPPFTSAQVEAYAKILAAIYDVTGQHPREWAPSHQEYAPKRKVDIGDYIYTIRNQAIYLVDNHIFAGDTPEPKPEPEIEEEGYDMFLVFDPRFGVHWAIQGDLTSKTMVLAGDVEAIKGGWRIMGIKYSDQLGFSAQQIDAVPALTDSKLVDIVGDSQGKA